MIGGDSMFCEKCGAEMSARAQFCRTCGTKRSEMEASAEAAIEPSPPINRPADKDVAPESPDLYPALDDSDLEGSDFLRREPAATPEPVLQETPVHRKPKPHVPPAEKEGWYASTVGLIEGAQTIWGAVVLFIIAIGLLTAWIQTKAPSPENAILATTEAEQQLAAAEAERLAEEERAARADTQDVLAAFEAAKASKQISKLGAFFQNHPNSQNRDEAKRLAVVSLRRQNSGGAKRVYQQYFGELPEDMKTAPAAQTKSKESETKKSSFDDFYRQLALDNDTDDDDGVETYSEISYVGPRDFDGEPHGVGKMTFTGGNVFEGRFEHGTKTVGKTTFSDGSTYTGGYRGANAHGQGIQVQADGTVYTGMLEYGKKSGKGEIIFKDGTKYSGYFKNDDYNGEGVYSSPDGHYLSGTFENDELNGPGIQKFPDGDSYTGNFLDGVFHGQGEYATPNGAKLSGTFTKGYLNGEGRQDFSDGSYYVGTFKNDVREGQGVHTAPGDRVYKGGFVNGQKEGTAEVSFADGSSYSGECKAGEAHGEGIYDDPAFKAIIYGTFYEGVLLQSQCKPHDGGSLYECEYDLTLPC